MSLRRGGTARVVNLEEIWATGAVLEAEEPFGSGDAPVEMRCGSVVLCGLVESENEHEFGWRIQIAFSPLTPWSPEKFVPEHLLDLSELE